jgi:hypothetical protein
MRSLAASALALVAFAAGPATAVPLTVSFEGTVEFIPAELASVFTDGDLASGFFQIESTTADTVPANPDVGFYPGPTSWSFTFGSYTATSAGGTAQDYVRIDNDLVLGITIDLYSAEAFDVSGAAIGSFEPTRLGFSLNDANTTAFSSDALPTSLDLADFSQGGRASIRFDDPVSMTSATVTVVLTSVTVPEPGALALLGLAGLGLAAARARRSR